MQPMTVQEITAAVHGVWCNPQKEVPVVTGVSTDSRKVAPGCLFLPWASHCSCDSSIPECPQKGMWPRHVSPMAWRWAW